MKKLMKSIDILLNSLKDPMNLNRFIILQKTMKYADSILAEIEKKERLLLKRKPKQLFFADEDSIPTESQFHPVSYFARSPEIPDNDE